MNKEVVLQYKKARKELPASWTKRSWLHKLWEVWELMRSYVPNRFICGDIK